jgi:V-type H+-transporting ATPase subunit a
MARASVFFPEPMDYVELAAPTDAAYHLVRELASDGHMELVDARPGGAKRYAENYMRCEEAERCLAFIGECLSAAPGALPPAPARASVAPRLAGLGLGATADRIAGAHADLRERLAICEDLAAQQAQARRRRACLRFFAPLLERGAPAPAPADADALELTLVAGDLVQAVAGLVPAARGAQLFKAVFRVSRGNAICHHGEAAPGALMPYALFVQSQTLLAKLRALCQAFSPDVFDFQPDAAALAALDAQLGAELAHQAAVERQAREVNRGFLAELGREFWLWRAVIARERQVWAALDYGDFDRADGVAFFVGWVPRRFTAGILPIRAAAQEASGSPREIAVVATPAEDHKGIAIPTFIEENEFTTGFQSLNNAYGIPNYDELNGGAFYCMYPFLFAVMFGDIGHALFYVVAAVAVLVLDPIVKRRKADLGEIAGAIFSMKWLLACASVCALYCGFVYNECFGLPIKFVRSAWLKDPPAQGNTQTWSKDGQSVYPFGMDPEWFFKDNELIFLNSYKMKLSVVMGMSQMVFGMVLQLIKHIHRRAWLEIAVVWIPEVLYLVPFFGYLVVIIIVKWCSPWKSGDEGVNLIQMLIGMILSIGSQDEALFLYSGQWGIQTGIVVIFILSIPAMLLIKPIIECVHLRGTSDFNVLEIFVMNLIHVIEFALGALSHTASYLRLWALSLAHSQLSKVLYEQLFLQLINMNAPLFIRGVLMVFGFAGFAVLTVAILLGMEAFSALLHAIRLMWVEFSSKFYEGMGTEFKPLSLRTALKSVGIS